MTDFSAATKLDVREEHFRIPGPRDGLSLFLRFLPAPHSNSSPRRAVLYVHGATFPSALSIAFRFDGKSWRDALAEAGFDVWGLDFYGFGHSDRYPEMARPGVENPPLCAAEDAARQVEAAVRFILGHQSIDKLNLISHSWGSMPVAKFAAAHPTLVDRLVLFAPIARRSPRRYEQPATFPAWRVVTLEDQWNRLSRTCLRTSLPCSHGLSSRSGGSATSTAIHKAVRAIRWESRHRSARSARSSRLGMFSSPMIRQRCARRLQLSVASGTGLVPDADARWLFDAFVNAPTRRDIKIGRGTHLMHLETMRFAL
jgi:pimeloyl-ACP methyl ester carboxylesterase